MPETICKSFKNVVADTVLHTVTEGKMFYLSDIVINAVNNSTNADGQYVIYDGDTEDDDNRKLAAYIPRAVIGEAFPQHYLAHPFQIPPMFASKVKLDILAGGLAMAVTIVGVEQ